jgi:hypothetical protein
MIAPLDTDVAIETLEHKKPAWLEFDPWHAPRWLGELRLT